RGRVVAVPDRGDDEHAVAGRVPDSRGLRGRVGVDGRVERVADGAEAEVDHTRAVVDLPANRLRLDVRVDRLVRADDLGDRTLGREGDPGNPLAVARSRRDLPRDEGPVADLVVDRAADEAPCERDLPYELGMAEVDAGVDDPDQHRVQHGQNCTGPEVERVVA